MDGEMVNDTSAATEQHNDRTAAIQPAGTPVVTEVHPGGTPTTTAVNQVETRPTQQVDTSRDSYKNPDGSFDMDRVLKDLATEKERADGLRRKLADSTEKPAPFQATDLAVQVPDEEREAMDDLVKSFNEYGISKDQADKIFGKFAAMIPSEEDQRKEADTRYKEEMDKLGNERSKILADLRSFTDTMLANKIWNDEQKKIFYSTVNSADVAKMFHSAIENFKVLGAGMFSSSQPGTSASAASTQRPSQQESIDLYRKAFQLAKTNPLDGELELKKLDKLFGLR